VSSTTTALLGSSVLLGGAVFLRLRLLGLEDLTDLGFEPKLGLPCFEQFSTDLAGLGAGLKLCVPGFPSLSSDLAGLGVMDFSGFD